MQYDQKIFIGFAFLYRSNESSYRKYSNFHITNPILIKLFIIIQIEIFEFFFLQYKKIGIKSFVFLIIDSYHIIRIQFRNGLFSNRFSNVNFFHFRFKN